jgi:riboflavin kinase/FMN adenylyltransferase
LRHPELGGFASGRFLVKLLRTLDDLPPAGAGRVVSIGNFDGVHRGHVRLVGRLKQLAVARNAQAVVFTFDPHPVQLLRPEQAPVPLTTLGQRVELLASHGADLVIAYRTDRALLGMSAQQFFAEVVLGRLKTSVLVEGPDFRFGRDRAGDVALLEQLACDASVRLEIVEPVFDDGQVVSSSRIRSQLLAGEVDAAARGLGRPYALEGTVQEGAGRGKALGFPTANLAEITTLIPADGVYACRGVVGEQEWAAAVNVGPNPTFGDAARKVEAHLLGFEGNLYGRRLRVEFLSRLRETRTFAGADQLLAQVREDIRAARHHVAALQK